MILNNIEMTCEEEAAMEMATRSLENMRYGESLTCGDLADYLGKEFPSISPQRCLSITYEAMRVESIRNKDCVTVRLPQPKPLSRPGARETNWDLHFSDPLRAAETMAKLRESLYGGEASYESSGGSDPESILLDWLSSPADESPAGLIDRFAQGSAL